MFNRKKLIKIMENKNITAYKLWKTSGVAQSTISDILNKEDKNPTMNTLSKLADALGVSVNEFFDEDDTSDKDAPAEKISKMAKKNKIETLAAHFEDDDLTDDDVEDIKNFIEFIVSKKKNK